VLRLTPLWQIRNGELRYIGSNRIAEVEMICSLEEEARLARVQLEAAQLDAPELRKVLRSTWMLWLQERRLLQDLLAAEGVHCRCEVQGAFPLELAARLTERERREAESPASVP
jgi:hypothetical protein